MSIKNRMKEIDEKIKYWEEFDLNASTIDHTKVRHRMLSFWKQQRDLVVMKIGLNKE